MAADPANASGLCGRRPLSDASLGATNATLLVFKLQNKELNQLELETVTRDLEASRRTRDNYIITNALKVTQASKLH